MQTETKPTEVCILKLIMADQNVSQEFREALAAAFPGRTQIEHEKAAEKIERDIRSVA